MLAVGKESRSRPWLCAVTPIVTVLLFVGCSADEEARRDVAGLNSAAGACLLVDPAAFARGGVLVRDPSPLSRLPGGDPLPTRDPRVERIYHCSLGSASALTVYDTNSTDDARSITDEFDRYMEAELPGGTDVKLPAGIRGSAEETEIGTGYVVWQNRDLSIMVLIGDPRGNRNDIAGMFEAVIRTANSKLESARRTR